MTPCLAHHMAVVANKDVKLRNLTSTQLARIFRGETKKWPDGRIIILVFHSSSTDEIVTLSHLNKMSTTEVKAMLISREDQDRDSIRTVASDAELIDTVASTPGAIGFVEERSINERVGVLKVDGKLPMESGYLPH